MKKINLLKGTLLGVFAFVFSMLFMLISFNSVNVYADSVTHDTSCQYIHYDNGTWKCENHNINVGDTLQSGICFWDGYDGEKAYSDGSELSDSEGFDDSIVVKIDGNKIYLCSDHSTSGTCSKCGTTITGDSSTPSGSNDSTIVTLTSFTIPTSLNMNEKTSVIFPEYTVEGSGSLSDVACGWAYEDPNDKEAKPIDGTYYVSADGLKPIAGKTYTYICEFAGNGLVDPIIKIGTNTYETYEVNPGMGYCAIIPIGVVNEDGTITVSEYSSKTTTSASDFTFTAPTTLTAGEARSANVTTSKSGMGTITVYYSSDNGGTWSTTAPSTAGTYKVAIDVTEGASYKAGTKITDDTWTFTLSSSTPSGSNDSTIVTLTSFTKPSKLTSTPQTIQKNTTQISGKGSYDYGTGYWRCEDDNGEYTIGDGKKYDIYYGTPVVGKTYVYIIEIKVTGATDVQLVCDGKTYDCTKKESLYFAKIVEGTSDAQGNITESPVRDCPTSVHICADSSHSSEKHFYSTGVTYETSWDSPTYVVGREYESGSYSDYYNGSGNSMAISNFGGTYAEGWYYQDGFYFFPCATGIPAISSATLTNVPTKYIVSGETYTVVDDEGNAVNVSDITIGESGQYTVTTIKAVYDSFWKNVQVYMLLRPNVNYKFNNSTSFSINGDTYSDPGIISDEEEKSYYNGIIGITDIQIGDVCIICGNEEYSTKTKTSANDVEYNETNAVYTAKTTGIGDVTTYYKVDNIWETTKPTIKGTYEVGFSIAENDNYAAFGSSTNVKTETPVKTFTVPFSYGKFNNYSTSGLEWKLSEDDKTLTIFKTGEGSGEMPDETPWASSKIAGKDTITTVIIGDGVISISPEAFKGQTAITSVTIPNTVTTINPGAFGGCTSLKSIEIPNSVKTIGLKAFMQSGLTSITIPSSVTTIGEALFSRCTALSSVTLPNSISSIPRGAFVECTSLTSITIPTSVTSIEEEAFNSSGLTSIKIPTSVTTLGKEAFYDCKELTNITFMASSLPTIEGKTFQNAGNNASGTKTVYIANSDETARNGILATLKEKEYYYQPQLPDDWVIAAKGHTFETPTYTWNSDNTICTITCPCSDAGCTEVYSVDMSLTVSSQSYSGNAVTVGDAETTPATSIQITGYNSFVSTIEALKVEFSKDNGETWSSTKPTASGEYKVRVYSESEAENPVHVITSDFAITPVVKIGDVDYASVKAAVTAAGTTESVIKLYTNVQEYNITIAADQTITIDLNGYVINADNQGRAIDNKGTLTIVDSPNSNADAHYFLYDENGNWVYQKDYTATGNEISFANIEDATLENGVSVIAINGGCITGGKLGKANGACILNEKTLTLSNGYIIGNSNEGLGAGIYGIENSSISMTGGVVCGNYAAGTASGQGMGGGIYGNTNILNITGGSLVFNITDRFGGAVTIDKCTECSISNCLIAYNKANSSGGGINYVGTTELILGEGIVVRNNTAKDGCAGVRYLGSSIAVSGKVIIKDNKTFAEVENNLQVPSGKVINVTNAGSGSYIGITTEVNPTATTSIVITGTTSEAVKDYFFSDNDDYDVIYSENALKNAVHTHSKDTNKHHDGVSSTCSATGTKEYWECTKDRCTVKLDENSAEISDLTIAIDPAAHNYGEITYTWNTDNTKCSATRVCSNDATHVETEEVNVVATVTQVKTCTLPELTKYTAAFTNTAFVTQTKENVQTAAALGHDYGNWTITTPATTESDAKHSKVCSVCHDTIVEPIENTKKNAEITNTTGSATTPDVKVNTPQGFDPNITVVVEVTVETKVESKINNNLIHNYKDDLKGNEKVGVVFDVKLKRTVNGVESIIQPTDLEGVTSIKVLMKLPEGLDITKVTRILHVHSATDIDEIPFDSSKVTSDGYYEITISKLSEFAFIYKVDGMPAGAIVGIVLGSLFLLLLLIYILGYFFCYRRGHLDDSSIKVIYVWLPRGDENKEELADNTSNEEPKKLILTKEERQQKALENKIKKLSATAMAYTAAVCIPVAEEGTEVVGIIYNEKSNVYLFGPLDNKLLVGDVVEVEDSNGVSRIVPVVMGNQCVSDEYISKPFKNIIRVLYHGEVEMNYEKNAEEILEEKHEELQSNTTTEEIEE